MSVPFVPSPLVVEAELLYLLDGQQMENTLYFQLAATPTILTMAALASDLHAWWADQIAPQTTAALTLRGIKVTSLESETAPAFELPLAVTGAESSPPLPNNVTFVVKFLTGGRGRSSRGRNYIVGLMESQVTGNTVASSTRAAFVAAYNDLRDSGTMPNGTWGVYSRRHDLAWRTEGLFQEITGVAVTDDIVDSQRRRLPGRGN